MEENKYRDLTPRQYIWRLFADTKDGVLKITYYPYNGEPPYTLTYRMDWTEADAEAVVQRYETLSASLRKLGGLREQLQEEARRKELLSPEEMLVWQTYLCPFGAFEVEQAVIDELYFRAEFDTLDDDENALLDRYYWWRERNSLERLPFRRCSPYNLILRAQRYEKLVWLGAPEPVLREESRCLAEEIMLYHFGPQQVQSFEE